MKKQLKELRKEVKPLGFKIKTEMFSWGRHLTYIHIKTGEELVFNVACPAQMERWRPLHEYLNTIPKGTIVEWDEEKVIGDMFHGPKA